MVMLGDWGGGRGRPLKKQAHHRDTGVLCGCYTISHDHKDARLFKGLPGAGANEAPDFDLTIKDIGADWLCANKCEKTGTYAHNQQLTVHDPISIPTLTSGMGRYDLLRKLSKRRPRSRYDRLPLYPPFGTTASAASLLTEANSSLPCRGRPGDTVSN